LVQEKVLLFRIKFQRSQRWDSFVENLKILEKAVTFLKKQFS